MAEAVESDDGDFGHLKPVPLGQEKGRTTGKLDLDDAGRQMKSADRADVQRHRQRIKEKRQVGGFAVLFSSGLLS